MKYIVNNSNDEDTWVRILHCEATSARDAIKKWEEAFKMDWVHGGSVYEPDSFEVKNFWEKGYTYRKG